MNTVQLDGWVLECDVEATRRAYEMLAAAPREKCDCLFCRNFEAARATVYPAEALKFYGQLGVTPSLEVETYERGPAELGGGRLYGGWHHFVGRVVQDPGRMTKLSSTFELWFREGRDLAGQLFGNQPLVQAEFQATVSWVLAERPDDASHGESK